VRLDISVRMLRAAVAMALFIGVPAYGADLLQVYAMALNNDPTFGAARETYRAAREKVPQALAGNLPTLNLTGSENTTGANASFNTGSPTSQGIYAWTWTLQLTQPLIRPQNVVSFYESEAEVEAAHAEFDQAQQDLILRVAQAYFDELVAEESVESAQAQVAAMEEQRDAAKRGFKLGTMSITDAAEATSRVAQSRADLIAAQNDLTVKRTELQKLTGRSVQSLARLKSTEIIPKPVPDDSGKWAAQSEDNNPVVRAQLYALKAAGYTLTKAKAENIWTLDFVASYGTSYASGSVLTPFGYESRVKSTVTGLQFNFPLFAGGLNSSHIREAIANRDKLSDQLEESRRKAAADAEQAYAGIVSGLAQSDALRTAVESGETSVKGNRAGYKLGIRINSDVLNAQQQLYSARRDLIKARYAALLAGLKLKAAAGILNGGDMEVINGMLQHPGDDRIGSQLDRNLQ
jgi:outer membrane protein